MKGVLKLGNVSGIKIEVHWTFTLLLVWVVFLDIQRGGTFQTTLFNMALILVLFACVILHELGHALTAKKFNIKTKKITLLPIGGVASLEKMPDKPGEELLVALAGPAVNVIIAVLLSLAIPLRSYFNFDNVVIDEMLFQPSLPNFLFYLFIANVMLVVFNMIPAFPMDGGRVLRALLSFKLGRVKATAIAATLGQAMALIFFVLGLLFNPFLVLIAFFIFFGAYGENQMVKQTSLLEGHVAREAMLTHITLLAPENTIKEVVDILLAGTEKDFVVLQDGQIMGLVFQKNIIKNAGNPSLLVRDIMHRDFKTIDESTEIVKVLELISKEKHSFIPVTSGNKLLGAIDMVNISEFILLKTSSA